MVLKPVSVIFALAIGGGCFFPSKSVADRLNLIDYSQRQNAQCGRLGFSFRQRDRLHPALGPRAYGSVWSASVYDADVSMCERCTQQSLQLDL